MKITLDVPQSVMRQAYAINELCAQSEGHVDLSRLSEVIDRKSGTIFSALENNCCPFGYLHGSEKRRQATLPVIKVWSWFMKDFASIVDYIEVTDCGSEDKP